jgi:hypothetical protein
MSTKNDYDSVVYEIEKMSSTTQLIVVSKTIDEPRLLPILLKKHIHFGENRVQEAQTKWPALKRQFPGTQLHLIGPLQTNKVSDALAIFDFIHTLDREKLALKLKDSAATTSLPQLFIQINTGNEPQKSGISTHEADSFINFCRLDLRLPVIGLMCIPPVDDSPTHHFKLLAELGKRHSLSELSMGMSGDYKEAIACGSTYVRVGSAIFGAR